MRRPNETDDEWRERMAAKADRQRYFIGLETKATAALHNPRIRYSTTAHADPEPADTTVLPKAHRTSECVVCHVRLRAAATPASSAPGSRQFGARGMCRRCTADADRAKVCARCDRPMRGAKRTVAQEPGTVPHGRGDLCKGCVRGRTPGFRAPDACVSCKEPMRKSGTLASDFPGTVRHLAGGVCAPCIRLQEKGKAS